MNGSALLLRISKANATASTSFPSKVASTVAALLHAVKNTCMSVHDAIVDLLQLLKPTTNKAKKAKAATSYAWTIPAHDAGIPTSTKRAALPRRRRRLLSTASTSSSTSACVRSTSATSSSSSTMTTIAAVRERSRSRGRFIQARRRHLQAAAASAARASITTDQLMDFMHSILTPASTSVPATSTPTPTPTQPTTPRMLRFYGRFARSPWMAPNEPPVFDDLLLPSSTNGPMTPATRARALRHFAVSPGLQMQWAALRIQEAAERRQQTPAPHDPITYECGCGWCPRGVAAYELCAAVTIRRTMRSFRPRGLASPSVATKLSRHQHSSIQSTTPVCGHVRA